MLVNNLLLVKGGCVPTGVEDNSKRLTLVPFPLKLIKVDGEVLNELLLLGQAPKQLLVMLLGGHSGGLVIMRKHLGVLVTRLGASATVD